MAKKGLGRGLDALLGESKAEDVIAPKQTAKTGDYVETIKIVDKCFFMDFPSDLNYFLFL